MLLAEDIIILAVAGFMVWQFAIPVLFGLPLFPLFRLRRSERELVAELAAARQRLAEDALAEELAVLMKQHQNFAEGQEPQQEPQHQKTNPTSDDKKEQE